MGRGYSRCPSHLHICHLAETDLIFLSSMWTFLMATWDSTQHNGVRKVGLTLLWLIPRRRDLEADSPEAGLRVPAISTIFIYESSHKISVGYSTHLQGGKELMVTI